MGKYVCMFAKCVNPNSDVNHLESDDKEGRREREKNGKRKKWKKERNGKRKMEKKKNGKRKMEKERNGKRKKWKKKEMEKERAGLDYTCLLTGRWAETGGR